MANKTCVFCKLSDLTILFQNQKYAIIKDIKPAAKYHLLVIPKEHFQNIKYLNKTNVEMINEMKSLALDYVTSNIDQADLSLLRLGFHMAPFNTVSHLHLHVLYPDNQLSLIQRSMFKVDSYWFYSVDAAARYLQTREN